MIFFFSCFVRTRHSVSNSPLKFNYISNNTKNADNRSEYIRIPQRRNTLLCRKGVYCILFYSIGCREDERTKEDN